MLVGAGQPILAIDDEHHEVRPAHRQLNLVLDVLGEIRVVEPVSARIDELDITIPHPQRGRDTIARYAWHILHNADALPRQRVEQRAFADVRPADNCDDGHLRHR